METKVIRISIDGNDFESAEDLQKKISDIIAEEISKNIETARTTTELAHKAFETWLDVKDYEIEEIKKACGGELPEGEDLMSLMFASGFKEGYKAKTEECSRCD